MIQRLFCLLHKNLDCCSEASVKFPDFLEVVVRKCCNKGEKGKRKRISKHIKNLKEKN